MTMDNRSDDMKEEEVQYLRDRIRVLEARVRELENGVLLQTLLLDNQPIPVD